MLEFIDAASDIQFELEKASGLLHTATEHFLCFNDPSAPSSTKGITQGELMLYYHETWRNLITVSQDIIKSAEKQAKELFDDMCKQYKQNKSINEVA